MGSNASHAQAKALFLAALERPVSQRLDFIAESDVNGHLRRDVEALLVFHDNASESDVCARAVRPRFATGDVFASRYRIVKRLGRGGTADVWQADDLTLDMPVALKLVDASDFRARAGLVNEARLARTITHPAVCRVYDVGESGGFMFLTMEFVQGGDLARRLRRRKRLPMGQVIDLAAQLCDGLAAAHARGVVHCDLKPTNVLIDDQGRARLADFGVARKSDGTAAWRGGTPDYMAPEQAAGMPTEGPGCDLWAFGLVLFEMLSGTHAFPDTTPLGVEPSVRVADIDWTRLPASTPRALRDLVGQCLVVDPDHRLTNAETARSMLLQSARPPKRTLQYVEGGKSAGVGIS